MVAAALLLSGCATLPAEQLTNSASRTYSDSRASVWQRILTGSARSSMFVRQADMANGVITADREFVPPPRADMFQSTIFNWADCGSGVALGRALSQRVEINYLVRQERDGRTTVTLNSKFRELRAGAPLQKPHWVECSSTGVLERDLLDSFHYERPV